MKKFYKFCFCLSLILIMALGPLAKNPTQAFVSSDSTNTINTTSSVITASTTELSLTDRQKLIIELINKLKSIQKMLDLIKLNNQINHGSSSPSSILINPGSPVFGNLSFGAMSTINKIIVKPSDQEVSSLIFYSDKNEKLVLTITYTKDTGVIILKKYTLSITKYIDGVEKSTQTYAPMDYLELKEALFDEGNTGHNFVSGPDRNFVDINMKFLLNNPIYYLNLSSYDKNLTETGTDCYRAYDKNNFRGALKLALDDNQYQYGDLNKIVSFVTPERGLISNKCVGSFNPNFDKD